MDNEKLTTLLSLSKEAQDWLKTELIRLRKVDKKKYTYRNLREITGLELQQLKRVVESDGELKIKSLVSGCQNLLSYSKNLQGKKRRE